MICDAAIATNTSAHISVSSTLARLKRVRVPVLALHELAGVLLGERLERQRRDREDRQRADRETVVVALQEALRVVLVQRAGDRQRDEQREREDLELLDRPVPRRRRRDRRRGEQRGDAAPRDTFERPARRRRRRRSRAGSRGRCVRSCLASSCRAVGAQVDISPGRQREQLEGVPPLTVELVSAEVAASRGPLSDDAVSVYDRV